MAGAMYGPFDDPILKRLASIVRRDVSLGNWGIGEYAPERAELRINALETLRQLITKGCQIRTIPHSEKALLDDCMARWPGILDEVGNSLGQEAVKEWHLLFVLLSD